MSKIKINQKYASYIEEGYYGEDINILLVSEYLDIILGDLCKIEGFKYHQIKLKFNKARFYTNLSKIIPSLGHIIEREVESQIDILVSIEDEVKKRLTELQK